jgi:hypothetical protein
VLRLQCSVADLHDLSAEAKSHSSGAACTLLGVLDFVNARVIGCMEERLCCAVLCCAMQGDRVMSDFVSHLALNPHSEVQHSSQQTPQGAVTISTIHAAKVRAPAKKRCYCAYMHVLNPHSRSFSNGQQQQRDTAPP